MRSPREAERILEQQVHIHKSLADLLNLVIVDIERKLVSLKHIEQKQIIAQLGFPSCFALLDSTLTVSSVNRSEMASAEPNSATKS